MRLPKQVEGCNRVLCEIHVAESEIMSSAMYGQTTTPKRCKACGCKYDGWWSCYCTTKKQRECIAGNSFLPVVGGLIGKG